MTSLIEDFLDYLGSGSRECFADVACGGPKRFRPSPAEVAAAEAAAARVLRCWPPPTRCQAPQETLYNPTMVKLEDFLRGTCEAHERQRAAGDGILPLARPSDHSAASLSVSASSSSSRPMAEGPVSRPRVTLSAGAADDATDAELAHDVTSDAVERSTVEEASTAVQSFAIQDEDVETETDEDEWMECASAIGILDAQDLVDQENDREHRRLLGRWRGHSSGAVSTGRALGRAAGGAFGAMSSSVADVQASPTPAQTNAGDATHRDDPEADWLVVDE